MYGPSVGTDVHSIDTQYGPIGRKKCCIDVLLPYPGKVHVLQRPSGLKNNNNGERLETYVIKGERGSGVICLNGAAARRVQVGDIVIIISYGLMTIEEAKKYKPIVVIPDENNQLPKKRKTRRKK